MTDPEVFQISYRPKSNACILLEYAARLVAEQKLFPVDYRLRWLRDAILGLVPPRQARDHFYFALLPDEERELYGLDPL